jgi:hypothetical protein
MTLLLPPGYWTKTKHADASSLCSEPADPIAFISDFNELSHQPIIAFLGGN